MDKLCRWAMLTAAIALFAGNGTASAQIKQPKVNVDLLPSVDKIVPGQSFDLAIRFDIEEDWHIYWINSGDAGMPPRIKWQLPTGLTAGRLQFPAPKKYVDKAKLVTNIHEGEVILIAPVAVDKGVSASSVDISGALRYLVCKEQCILQSKDLKVSIPVAAGGSSKPANADVFKQARRSLPEAQSKYLTLSPKADIKTFTVGTKFDFNLGVKVKKGHHVQSNKPSMETFVATELFMEPTSGVMFDPPKYPKAHLREVKYLGKMSEFTGDFNISVAGEIDELPEGGKMAFAGVLKYQVCTDAGQCYPPASVKFRHEIIAQEARTDAIIEKAKKLAESGDSSYQPWAPGLAEQLSNDGHIVFVEVTAEWCAPCKMNREMVIDTPEVKQLMDEFCVVKLLADYTDRDEKILNYTQTFGREGVPFAAVYPSNDPTNPIIMPVKLARQPQKLVEALQKAGENHECSHSPKGVGNADEASDGTSSDSAVADSSTDDSATSTSEDTTGAVVDAGDETSNEKEAGTESGDETEAAAGTVSTGLGSTGSGLLYALGFAFLGGLILNIMPCVLPVISIKVLSFVQQAGEDPKRVFQLGLVFSAGVVISFMALAGIIIGLKSSGSYVTQGFQFQNPVFIIGMTAFIFAFGLSLFGVFEITLPGGTVSNISAAEEREGAMGAFMKGVLATVLATPCTAPFLGSALGLALHPSTSNATLLLIFTVAGIGMASPYILLTWQPAWLKFVPRPGAWMETFKQFMGFLLMGTVVFLLYPLKSLIGAEGLFFTAIFLTCVGLAVWVLGRQTPLTPAPKRLLAWVTAIGIVGGGWYANFGYYAPLDALVITELERAGLYEEWIDRGKPDWDSGATVVEGNNEWKTIPWRKWKKGLPERIAAQGHTVFVDFTATWCATCIANKKATIDTPEVRELMQDLCVVPLKADFTAHDPDIVTILHDFQRGGVPLNVIYPAERPGEPISLPEQLIGRQDLVLEKLKEAGGAGTCEGGFPPNLLGSAGN